MKIIKDYKVIQRCLEVKELVVLHRFLMFSKFLMYPRLNFQPFNVYAVNAHSFHS